MDLRQSIKQYQITDSNQELSPNWINEMYELLKGELTLTKYEQQRIVDQTNFFYREEMWQMFIKAAVAIKIVYPELFAQIKMSKTTARKIVTKLSAEDCLSVDGIAAVDRLWFYMAVLFPEYTQKVISDPGNLLGILEKTDQLVYSESLATYLAICISHGYQPNEQFLAQSCPYVQRQFFAAGSNPEFESIPCARVIFGQHWSHELHISLYPLGLVDREVQIINALRKQQNTFSFLQYALELTLVYAPVVEIVESEIQITKMGFRSEAPHLPTIIGY